MLINDLEIDPKLKQTIMRSGAETLQALVEMSPIQLLSAPSIGFAEVGEITCMLAQRGLVLRPLSAKEGVTSLEGHVKCGPPQQIRIDNPEFLDDMAVLGRELTRCFGRASCSLDFLGSAITELEQFHTHLVSMNQGPEAILADAAVQFLRRGGDRNEEITPIEQPEVPPQAESQTARPPTRKPKQTVLQKTQAGYSDLPASFFKTK